MTPRFARGGRSKVFGLARYVITSSTKATGEAVAATAAGAGSGVGQSDAGLRGSSRGLVGHRGIQKVWALASLCTDSVVGFLLFIELIDVG